MKKEKTICMYVQDDVVFLPHQPHLFSGTVPTTIVLVHPSPSVMLPIVMADVPRWKNVLANFLRILGLAGTIALVVLAAIAGFLFWKIHHWAPPANGKHMEEVFNTKRASFEQLVHMALEDITGGITVGNGILYSEHLSQERVSEYRNVASSIDPELKFSAFYGRAPTFTFEEETFGLAIGSHYANGIEYIPAVDEKFVVIVRSVEGAKLRKLNEYWVPLADHWYLFHIED